jgi:catechol 2,3-dioxygenase-like lactoylglutathione lyase family enzyme
MQANRGERIPYLPERVEVQMYDHVALPVRDVEASRRFYEPVMDQLGAKVVHESPGFVLFGNDSGMLALRERDEVLPIHVAFRTDRAGVDAFYAAAMGAGGVDNGAPGLRADYHEHYYAAFVHDPDGHNIEAVSQAPA